MMSLLNSGGFAVRSGSINVYSSSSVLLGTMCWDGVEWIARRLNGEQVVRGSYEAAERWLVCGE